MKKQTTQTAETIALIVNSIKTTLNNFTLEELSNLLKQNECPYWNRIATILNSRGFLVKSNKGKYNFSLDTPIYYMIFDAEIKKIAARQSDYTKKWMNKLGKTKTNVLDVDKAITLLKSLGYKIFKEI